MRTAQQIRKEIVEQKYSDILLKIEEEIDKNKLEYCVNVVCNTFDVNVSEIEEYMRDLGYSCDYEWSSDVGFGFKISW